MYDNGRYNTFAQVLAVGNWEVMANWTDGRGVKPIGGAYGIPVMNNIMSSRVNANIDDLIFTEPFAPVIEKIQIKIL